MRIARRRLLLSVPALLVARPTYALPVPASKALRFDIVRNGSVIGTHSLLFEPVDDALTVRIAADISIGLGPITLFRYRHRAVEHWQRGEITALDAETNDDGTVERTTVRRSGRILVVDGTKSGRYEAPPGTLPATHWNRQMLEGPMINTQDGRLMRPTVTRLGPRRLDGPRPIMADEITLRGDADFDTWYDSNPTWVGLRFTARDGSVIRYQRQ